MSASSWNTPPRASCSSPRHPYTPALQSAVPVADPGLEFAPVRLTGEIPTPKDAPPGCRLHTCGLQARARCRTDVPAWREIAPEHFVAGHFAEDFHFSRPETTRDPDDTA